MTLSIAVALVTGHVLGETLRPRAGRRVGRVVGVALAVGAAAYVAAGAWALWPVPVVAVVLFGVADVVHRRFPTSASAWVTLQVGTLAAIAALAGLTLPALVAAGRLPAMETTWVPEVFVALMAGVGLVASVGLGGTFMNLAIRPFAVEMRGKEIVEKGGRVLEPLENGFENGGRVIGHYERLLIFLFVLASAPTAIGFLVAAKSILRFGELQDGKNRKNAEYVIIGTLMSFAYALIVAYGTRLALGLLATP